MFVGRQSVGDSSLSHHYKTDGIAERIGFVEPIFQQFHCLVMGVVADPHQFKAGPEGPGSLEKRERFHVLISERE